MKGAVLDASQIQCICLWEGWVLRELSVPATVRVSETASLTALRQAFGIEQPCVKWYSDYAEVNQPSYEMFLNKSQEEKYYFCCFSGY